MKNFIKMYKSEISMAVLVLVIVACSWSFISYINRFNVAVIKAIQYSSFGHVAGEWSVVTAGLWIATMILWVYWVVTFLKWITLHRVHKLLLIPVWYLIEFFMYLRPVFNHRLRTASRGGKSLTCNKGYLKVKVNKGFFISVRGTFTNWSVETEVNH